MTDKPLLFWDVDGVFNRFALQNVPGGHWLRTTVDMPGFPDGVPLVLDRADTARVRSLDDVVEHAWATTWNDYANTILAPLIGLDPMPVAGVYRKFSEYDQTAQWKWRHVVEYADGRPFVWIDDAFTPRMHRAAELRRWMSSDGRPAFTLLLDADPAIGLTDEMVDRVREFAATAAR